MGNSTKSTSSSSRISLLFCILLTALINLNLNAQVILTDITPEGLNQPNYLTTINSKMLLSFKPSWSIGGDNWLYEYDGKTFKAITPEGYKNPSYLCSYLNKWYFNFTNADNNKILLFEYDGTTFKDITPINCQTANYLTVYIGKLYLSFADNSGGSNDKLLYKYDGVKFEEISLVGWFGYSIFLCHFNGKCYFYFRSNETGNDLVEYDGFTFQSIMPEGLDFPKYLGQNQSGVLFQLSHPGYSDINIFFYNGMTRKDMTYEGLYSSSPFTSMFNKPFMHTIETNNRFRLHEINGSSIPDITPVGYEIYVNGYLGMYNNQAYMTAMNDTTYGSALLAYNSSSFHNIPLSAYKDYYPMQLFSFGGKGFFKIVPKGGDGSTSKLVEYDGKDFKDITPSGYSPQWFMTSFGNAYYLTMQQGTSSGNSRLFELKKKVIISGRLFYDNAAKDAIKNTQINLKKEGNIFLSTTSDNSGNYIFPGVPDGEYTIEPVVTTMWGGSDPSDALIIIRSYIGVYTFSDALLETAADVTGDKNITPTDALILTKRYLNVLSKFKVPDWLYFKSVINTNGNDFIQDIKVVCSGDPNASYKPK